MSFNANGPFNAQIRAAGNRSRALPDIGQGAMQQPAPPQPAPAPAPMMAQAPAAQPAAQPVLPMGQAPVPGMAAPAVQPQTFTMHPAGSAADQHQYNYEPQPDGSWRVYPPGVQAPHHTISASLPRAASTGDYIRLSRAFQQMQRTPPAQAPTPPTY